MVLLKTLKRQINHFVGSDAKIIDQDTLSLISKNEIAPQKKPLKREESLHYSHGLEKIYELESVDPKTIRKFGESDPEESPEERFPKAKRVYPESRPLQRPLPFTGWEEYSDEPIDLEALIQASLSKNEEMIHCANLEKYRLEQLVALSPLMAIERKRASEEVKARWIEQSRTKLRESGAKVGVDSAWKRIVDFHLLPWMRRREGVATDYELYDLLEVSVAAPHTFESCMEFISSCFYGGKNPLISYLPHREGTLFFVSEVERQRFEEVERLLLSYFYQTTIAYRYEALIAWALRESAKAWLDYDLSFVEKVVALSPFFSLQVDEKGQQVVIL